MNTSNTTIETVSFSSMSEFKAAYKAAGMHFFDRKTMNFFKSRIESGVLKDRFFITSESDIRGENRFYNLREIESDLGIRTIGEFNSATSKETIKRRLNTYLSEQIKKD